MFDRLLPTSIDNTYRGRGLALWLFGLVAALRAMQSLVIIFNGRAVARDADGIPLDAYAPDAAQTAVALFAQGALWRLVIALLCLLVLARYRSAVPFMFAVLALGFLGSQLLLLLVPLVRVGTPPGPYVNLATFALMVVGLALSLWKRRGESA
ncbi:MAG TPA: hypothetical protein VF736_01380 [Pyrinomonadaceae bacterium]